MSFYLVLLLAVFILGFIMGIRYNKNKDDDDDDSIETYLADYANYAWCACRSMI